MAKTGKLGAQAHTAVDPHGVPMADVLRAVAAELADLGDAADGLQGLVGRLMREQGGQISRATLEDAQALDSVVQRLGAVSTFLHELTNAVDENWRVDTRNAADLLLLAAVAQRLSRPLDPGHEIAHDDGHCDFF